MVILKKPIYYEGRVTDMIPATEIEFNLELQTVNCFLGSFNEPKERILTIDRSLFLAFYPHPTIADKANKLKDR